MSNEDIIRLVNLLQRARLECESINDLAYITAKDAEQALLAKLGQQVFDAANRQVSEQAIEALESKS